MSTESISLHGGNEEPIDLKPGSGSAILFKLSDSVLREIQKASQMQDGLSFTTGSTPVRELSLIFGACSEQI